MKSTTILRIIGLFFLSLRSIPLLVNAEDSSDEEDPHYLYNGEGAFPVQDYHGIGERHVKRPKFLFSKDNGPRMVEFYAYWCPHCRHFRDHYIQLARQVTTVALDQDVEVGVYAVSCTEYHDICSQFDIEGYPKLKIFKANETTPKDVHYWEAHPFDILKDLGIRPNKPLTFDKSLEVKNEKTDETIVRRSKTDVFNDAHLSFHFAMKNSIYMGLGPLSNTTRDAFYDWLTLLQQAMPPTWEIQNLLTALVDDFDHIAKSEENLVQVADKFPPPAKKWSAACEKGVKGMGYTCGLWELFHIMTVGVVEYNLMIYDGDHLIMPVDDVSVTLRNYIEHFFACEVCRMNFLHGFDTCARDRCSRLQHNAASQKEWIELPLWLFEFHNGVNVRLMRERAERENWTPTREDEIKAEWPPRRECPKCWREDGGWNEDMVYKFLRTEYWLDDAVAGVYRHELSKVDEEDDDESVPSITLQLIPIVVVIGMAVGWYVKERERRRTGLHKRVA